jgi:two-component system KDP operon response regulator KdpE
MAYILIVEDDPYVLTLVERKLEGADFEVFSASDSKNAITRAQVELPQLAIIDIMLPDGDGIEVCRQIKQLAGPKEVPVIILTAISNDEERTLAAEAGADDYVVKPFAAHELLLRVFSYLGA